MEMTGDRAMVLLDRKREPVCADFGLMEDPSEKGLFVGERGVELGPYTAVRAWIGRVASRSGQVATKEG